MFQPRTTKPTARKPRITQSVLSGVICLALCACTAQPTEPETATDQESTMTTSNSQVIETIYENFAKGDVDGVLSVMADDVVWFHPGSKDEIPLAGEFNGIEGVREFFTIAGTRLDVLDQEVFSTVAEGDQVLVRGREHMRVKDTGGEYDTPWIHAYTLKDGKVVRFEEYIDTAQMRDAFAGS